MEDLEIKCRTTLKAFVIQTHHEPKLKDRFNEPQLQNLLSLVIVKIIALSGIKTVLTEMTKEDLQNLILSVYKHLTLDEIYKAFEMERFGLYEQKTEHFQLFDANYVSEILKKYVKWKQDFKDKHKITVETPPALPEYTESQKAEILNKGIVRQFEHYKTTNQIEIPFIHIFENLVQRGFIKLSQGESTPNLEKYYNEIRVKAAEEVQYDLLREKNSKNLPINDFQKLKQEYKKAQEGTSDLIDLKVKEIVLKQFFNKHITSKTNFKDFIYGNGN